MGKGNFKRKVIVGTISILCIFTACKNATSPNNHQSVSPKTTQKSKPKTENFPFPIIPEILTAPEDRKAYLLTHYWEQFDFADTVLINNRDVTEQGFVNFIALLADGTTPEKLAKESLGNWCNRFLTSTHARKVLTNIADNYLYNPNSPFYNERLYGLYLQTLLDKLPKEDALRSSYNFRLQLVKRNNPGNTATDFTYYLADGQKKSLQSTPIKGDYLLLLFYDPECDSCHKALLEMTADKQLAKAIRAGKLSVLAIYTEGNEEAWRKALPDLPQSWMTGTDREAVKLGALYDLKAMPSLYLLDQKQQVILKDATYEAIRQILDF